MTNFDPAEVFPEPTYDDRLVAFLYTLARDHLPTGVIEGMLTDMEPNRQFRLSSPEIASLARGWADKLKKQWEPKS